MWGLRGWGCATLQREMQRMTREGWVTGLVLPCTQCPLSFTKRNTLILFLSFSSFHSFSRARTRHRQTYSFPRWLSLLPQTGLFSVSGSPSAFFYTFYTNTWGPATTPPASLDLYPRTLTAQSHVRGRETKQGQRINVRRDMCEESEKTKGSQSGERRTIRHKICHNRPPPYAYSVAILAPLFRSVCRVTPVKQFRNKR